MDAFQPGPESERAFRHCLGCYATGVTVVTATTPDGPLAMTANSFASVSLTPPLVLWSPAKRSSRHAVFTQTERFAIHVLAADQKPLAQRFSRAGDDFKGVDWQFCEHGQARLSGVLARFVCAQEAIVDGGDHSIVIGRVLQAQQRNGDPLIFSGGKYGAFSGT